MKFHLFVKGMCMGIADVIPGVSGGTLALVLGIYSQFVQALRSLNPKPLIAAFSWFLAPRSKAKKKAFTEALRTVDFLFLIPLGLGIFSALVLGSLIIPRLLDDYPEIMRGLFFGLILASIGVPLKMTPKDKAAKLGGPALTLAFFLVFGYLVTDPNRSLNIADEWTVIEASSDGPISLKDLSRQGPSALGCAALYWSDQNQALRQAFALDNPQQAAKLADFHAGQTALNATDKHGMKVRSSHYNDLEVPPGTSLRVPRPTYLFVFLAGVIAISAMVLPGISGSFILLILGCYYFVLGSAKGSLSLLVRAEFPGAPLYYLICFAAGCLLGLMSFSRVLSFLLTKFPTQTMAALVGLMVGCLRGIWPWRQEESNGDLVNVLPDDFIETAWPALVAMVIGVAMALALERLGRRKSVEI